MGVRGSLRVAAVVVTTLLLPATLSSTSLWWLSPGDAQAWCAPQDEERESEKKPGDELLGDIDNPHLAKELPPAARVTVSEAISSAVHFLVSHQNANGSFGKKTSGRDYEIMASIPGSLTAFEVASTALCWLGLREAASTDESYDSAESRQVRRKALRFLVEEGRVQRANPVEMYNIWALAYALQALAGALDHPEELEAAADSDSKPGSTKPDAQPDAKRQQRATEERVRATIDRILKALEIYQVPDGGWTYYDFDVGAYRPSDSAMTFVTGTVLVAVAAAQKHGFEIPKKVIDRAVRSIVRCRTPEKSYLYGTYLQYRPAMGINRPKGSAMRNPVCDWVLHHIGQLSDADLIHNMKVFRKEHRFSVAALRRPIPHESWYQVSGYFYLYGHMYAAMVLERLPEEKRQDHWSIVVEGTLKSRQKDGSYWDYPLYGYHKFYGTGMALFALAKSAQ